MDMSRNVQSIDINWLKEHPSQYEVFSETSELELLELAADLKVRGQQEPIHCCPDGTIIRGHRRVKAAISLGWPTIKGIIREDLNDPNSDLAVKDFIFDNLIRRRPDDLTLARCYRHLKQLSRNDDVSNQGDLRDVLAAKLGSGKSGRSLDRLERLLDLPRDVQDMISRGELNKSQGEKILRLSMKAREKLFRSLRSGEPIVSVLKRHGIIKSHASKQPVQLGQDLIEFFHKYGESLSQSIEELDRLQIRGAEVLPLLDRAVTFLAAWRDRKSKLHEQSVEAMRESCVGFRSPDNLSSTIGN